MTLYALEHMTKVLGIRPIVRLAIVELKTLTSLPHEEKELVGFEQCNERIHKSVQIALHKDDERRPARSHIWNLTIASQCRSVRSARRFIHDRCDIRHRFKRGNDPGTDIAPIKTSQT